MAAAAQGQAMALAIVDDGGHPLRLFRAVGAGKMTGDVALSKARTAALARTATAALEDRLASQPALLALTAYLPMAGGVPLLFDGVCIGGIGVSGGTRPSDEAIAAAGASALAG